MDEIIKSNNSIIGSCAVVCCVACMCLQLAEEVILKLKNKNTSAGKQDDMQRAMQLSMQHKQNLFLSVQKTIQDSMGTLQTDCRDQCSRMLQC